MLNLCFFNKKECLTEYYFREKNQQMAKTQHKKKMLAGIFEDNFLI